MNTRKKTLRRFLACVGFLLLAAALALVYARFGAKPTAGSKNVTIEVVSSAADSTVYSVSTDAAYLLGAMEDAEDLRFEGSEGPYGLMIHTVNGETADYSADQSYWSFYVNGEYCNYGVSEQPVADGDAFKIAYTR